MAKDPAFLFYHHDFLVGTDDMSLPEVGAYIRCLCYQASKGGITESHMKKICETSEIHMIVKAKFSAGENGLFFNERLKLEVEKRKAFSESRKLNRSKPNKSESHMKHTSETYESHMVNVNEDVIVNEVKDETAKEKKPKVSKTEIEIVYPFDSHGFIEIWNAWKQYRKEIGKPIKSALSEQQALLDLQKYGEDTAIKMIRQSIANSWQGIFPLKTNTNGQQKSAGGNTGKNQPGLDEYKADLLNRLQNG
jgi:hypothetical protein